MSIRMGTPGAVWRGLACAWLLVAVTGCTGANQGAFEKVFAGQSRVVDLSHPIEDGMRAGLDQGACRVQAVQTLESDGMYVNQVVLSEATGTNIEAPARVLAGSPTVDRLPLRQFMGYGVVIDITEQVADDPGYRLKQSDIEVWESDHGAIPPEAIVLIRTGWDARWSDTERYVNRDSSGRPVFPGISAEAVDFLIRERRVHAVGIDTMSLYLGSGNETGQRGLLVTGKFHINNLTHLDQLPPRGSVVMAFPICIAGGSGAPARVLAIIPQEKTAVEPGKKKVEQGSDAGFDQSRPGAMGY